MSSHGRLTTIQIKQQQRTKPRTVLIETALTGESLYREITDDVIYEWPLVYIPTTAARLSFIRRSDMSSHGRLTRIQIKQQQRTYLAAL